jgi:acetylornithine/N-succinyldiaminopimelate aminotransferase
MEAHTNAEWVKRAESIFTPNYKPAPIVLTHGEGVYVFDEEGRRYLDLVSGIAVSALGHGHPALVAAIASQAQKLIHTSNLYYNEPSIRLGGRLVTHSGLERVFFCNSGAEANEAAIKIARRFHFDRGDKERVEIITFEHGFHGRTMGALAATAQPKYHEGFEPLPRGFRYESYGDVARLEAAAGPKTAAIMLEPLQGEGGVRPAPKGFLKEVRRIADQVGALVIMDEVQTGLGRTGKLFCHQHEGVRPDVLTLAKGIGGGLPLGAMLTTQRIGASLVVGTHATTFGGNPVATAAGNVVLDALESPGFLQQIIEVGEQLRRGLAEIGRRHGAFTEVRGQGLLIGAELAPSVSAEAKVLVDHCRRHDVLAHVAGPRVLRLAPPLILDSARAEEGLVAIEAAVSDALAAR